MDRGKGEGISQFCKNVPMGRATFYKQPLCDRPDVIYIGSKPVITPEAKAKWLEMKHREARLRSAAKAQGLVMTKSRKDTDFNAPYFFDGAAHSGGLTLDQAEEFIETRWREIEEDAGAIEKRSAGTRVKHEGM